MSSKKSDILQRQPEAAQPLSPWWRTLGANWAIPLAFAALWPLNYLVMDSGWIDSYQSLIILLVGIGIILAVSLQLINGISGQFSLGHAGFMAIGAYLSAWPMMNLTEGGANPFGPVVFYAAVVTVTIIAGAVLLAIFLLMRRSGRIHRSLPTILLVLLSAWFLVDVAHGAQYEGPAPWPWVWTRGFELLVQLFMTILGAAAGTMRLANHLPAALRPSLSFLTVLTGGGVCAAIAGLLVGLPTLRLRGDYFAIATLGFGEIIRVVVNQSEALGGATGMYAIPSLTNFAWLYGAVIVTVVVVWRIAHSARGRALAAVREDELAAGAIGINPTYYKVFAFVIGAFFAGVAGGLFAHLTSYLNPTQFGFLKSVEIVVIVVLAGLGSITGAILTAIVLTALPEMLRSFSNVQAVIDLRMVFYSLLLIGMMLLRPQGLFGSRELWWTRRRQRRITRKELGEGTADIA